MFASLTIYLTRDIKVDSQKYDSLITIESIRDNIIKLTDHEPELIRDMINNQKNSMPYIIYSRPYKNQIRIFALTENGKLALNSIFVNLIQMGTIKIKDEIYKIKGRPVINDEVSFLPQQSGKMLTYTTLTPINVFNKHNLKIFDAILGSCIGGSYKNGTKEQQEAFNKEAMKYANEQIKDYIKYMLSKLIPVKKKEDFEFVDAIIIEWEDFNIIHSKYHSEEKYMPMVVGKFKSNFILPKFVGYKIGKGFGELSLKSKGA